MQAIEFSLVFHYVGFTLGVSNFTAPNEESRRSRSRLHCSQRPIHDRYHRDCNHYKCIPDVLETVCSSSFFSLSLIELLSNRIVGRAITTIPKTMKRAARQLSPIYEERLQQEAQHGKNWSGKSVCSFYEVNLSRRCTYHLLTRMMLFPGCWIELVQSKKVWSISSGACWLSTWAQSTPRPW